MGGLAAGSVSSAVLPAVQGGGKEEWDRGKESRRIEMNMCFEIIYSRDCYSSKKNAIIQVSLRIQNIVQCRGDQSQTDDYSVY